MNLILRASRPLTLSAHLLCALFLFILAAPMCAATGVGPTITNANVTPATLPVTGGVITVTATITEPAGHVITGVTATVTLTGNATFSGYHTQSLTLSNGGSGSTYTGNLSSVGPNTTTAPFTYTATITATDDQMLSTQATAAGQTVQPNDNTPPVIANASVSPAGLPYTGGVITVTATITDIPGRTVTAVSAVVTLTGNATFSGYHSQSLTLSSGGSGTYSGNISSVGTNTDVAPFVYTATVTATNDLSLANTATAIGRTVQADKDGTVPTASNGVTHISWTNTDGRLSLWNYDPLSGGFTQITYGPYPGWSAKAVADGPDGKTRVLWDNANGTMSLWSLDNTTGIFTQNSFGPYPGWTATDLSVAP